MKLRFGFIVLLSMFLIGCGLSAKLTGSAATTQTEMKKFLNDTGLNNIEWINVTYRKVEPHQNYPVTVSVTRQDNPNLVQDFEQALEEGAYRHAPMPKITGTIDLAIKLTNGKYIQAPYDGYIFIHPKSDLAKNVQPTGVVITPAKEFNDLVNKLITGQVKVKAPVRNGQTGAIIRNNEIHLEKVNPSAYSDDPEFRTFSRAKGESLQDYDAETLRQGIQNGIEQKQLQEALETANNKIGSDINKVPVIIETVNYQGKESLLLAFAWELGTIESDKLGHIWVIVVERGSGKVLFSDHCS